MIYLYVLCPTCGTFLFFVWRQVTEETLKTTMGRGYDYANESGENGKGDAPEETNKDNGNTKGVEKAVEGT